MTPLVHDFSRYASLAQRQGERYGLCVWQGGEMVPRVHDFSRYAWYWRHGKATAQDVKRAEAAYREAK